MKQQFSAEDIQEGLRLLEELRAEKQRAEQNEEDGIKEKVSTWFEKTWLEVRKSKHFDLLKTLLISIILAVLSYNLPTIYYFLFGKDNVNASFAMMQEASSFAAFKFFIARLVVDTSLYFNENKFYVFMKRNGNLAFDYQENLTDLNKWQQTKITTIKYIAYLFLFAFFLHQA